MMAWRMIGPSQVKLSIGDEMKMKCTYKKMDAPASTAATNAGAKWRCCAEGCANGYGDGRMTEMFGMINFPSWGIMPEHCWGIVDSVCETGVYLNYLTLSKQRV